LILVFGWGYLSRQLQAASVDELRQQIDSHNAEIKKLDEEIAKYRTAISQTKTEATSLKKEIDRLELAKKKLQADIELTQNKISVAELKIRDLSQGITTTEEKIGDEQRTLAEALRLVNMQEQTSFPELVINQGTLADLWSEMARYQSLNEQVIELVNSLRQNKKDLETNKQQKEIEKKDLISLNDRLSDQKKITEQTKQSKNTLLTDTKSKESAYQKLLADRIKKKDQVLAEIDKVEAELKYTLDPSSIPKRGSGVLSLPVAKKILTQGFGQTVFSASAQGLSVYNGKGHNGIDLGGAIGDLIYSAESGTVVGTGDTDVTCKGASYGKWILIRHNNGLSTLYAHLSAIKVQEGQAITVGQVIGYMGNTGYSTGPHLHFSLYASDGVKVSSLQSKVAGCGVYRLPVASYNAYLNPLNYL